MTYQAAESNEVKSDLTILKENPDKYILMQKVRRVNGEGFYKLLCTSETSEGIDDYVEDRGGYDLFENLSYALTGNKRDKGGGIWVETVS